MNIQLHQNARTTPEIRLELQAQPQSVTNQELARAYNLNRHTVAKWRQRAGTEDASHRPQRLHTTLSVAQEAVVVALRETLLLSLDDLLAVTHEFIHPEVSRSGLDRCLRRHGVSNLKALLSKEKGTKTLVKSFKEYAPGFVRIDVKYLPQMPDHDQRGYLFVAIDRITHWVYAELLEDKSARSASGFLLRLIDTAPFTVACVLTDDGIEFTDRFRVADQHQPTSGTQVFADTHLEHRRITPRTPRINGMTERFNGCISEVLATARFDSAEHLADTIKRYVQVYNQHIPQKALGYIPPLKAMRNCYKEQPNLFKKCVCNLVGPDR